MQNNFNFVAPFYDPLAKLIFGSSIQNSQTWLLPFIPQNATVLIIGGGTGWILEEMLKQTNVSRILYLEASEKMLEQSQKRYAKSPRKSAVKVEFRLGTEQELKREETFDVVFTGFLLDLFQPENLQLLMHKLYTHLKPAGLWLLADFAPQNATRYWQKSLLKSMVLFFKLTANLQANRLPEIEKAFEKFPLVQKQKKHFYHDLIFGAVYLKR
ncbi:class I SAM-dependent methyltransferase [Adhaeribacter sp. BT258]|uniref:Class I SAM-dependent methyltransferase n=1 Tax=Adhaeribacter terrigena TaxID=2793070 RepID=A0ABS1BY97_9BACT|nr:class I SAM-dependent methyltransferase [Adhaeribacter terrigena]MBK0402044.1 class I SAM-dependent methyltransferase [Adhaeribacter terrigena]